MSASKKNKKNQELKHIDLQYRQSLSEKKRLKEENKQIAERLEAHKGQIKIVVKTIMKNIKIPPSMSFDDLESFGLEGLLKAIKKFDDSKGANFKTYAMIRIRGEILDAIRKEWRYRSGGQSYKDFQNNLNQRLETFLDETEQSSSATLLDCSGMMYLLSLDEHCYISDKTSKECNSKDLSDQVEEKESMSILWKTVASLPKEEHDIIRLFYQFNMTQQEIADKLKVSQSKICRLHGKILLKLKQDLDKFAHQF